MKLRLFPQALFWAGAVAEAYAVVCLCLSVYPDISDETAREVLGYFGHVAQYPKREELKVAIETHAMRAIDRLVDQLWVVSRIVLRKYRNLRRGMWALGIGSALVLAGLLLEQTKWV